MKSSDVDYRCTDCGDLIPEAEGHGCSKGYHNQRLLSEGLPAKWFRGELTEEWKNHPVPHPKEGEMAKFHCVACGDPMDSFVGHWTEPASRHGCDKGKENQDLVSRGFPRKWEHGNLTEDYKRADPMSKFHCAACGDPVDSPDGHWSDPASEITCEKRKENHFLALANLPRRWFYGNLTEEYKSEGCQGPQRLVEVSVEQSGAQSPQGVMQGSEKCVTAAGTVILPADYSGVQGLIGKQSDPVNHPAHYTDGKIEVIDFIEDKKLGFNLGNAVKYISRAGKKDPARTIEDLSKGEWYLRREIERLKKEKANGAEGSPKEVK